MDAEFHPRAVHDVAEAAAAAGDVAKAIALYRAILKFHPHSLAAHEALKHLKDHQFPPRRVEADRREGD